MNLGPNRKPDEVQPEADRRKPAPNQTIKVKG